MNSKEALSRLKEGNKRFVADMLDGQLQDSSRRENLTSGQEPYAIILSCADSRVVPELAFDTGLGEIFTIRVAGNIANASSIASIEYAVAHLGTKLVVVMGHQSCGAVAAAIQGGDNGSNLNHLLSHIEPAVKQCEGHSDSNEVVKVNAKLNAEDLIAKSDIIKDKVTNDNVEIVSAYYNLDSGKVEFI